MDFITKSIQYFESKAELSKNRHGETTAKFQSVDPQTIEVELADALEEQLSCFVGTIMKKNQLLVSANQAKDALELALKKSKYDIFVKNGFSLMSFLFTSESVSEGHPDKICDQLSDAILDAMLTADPNSYCAAECFTTTNLVLVGGEIKSNARIDVESIVKGDTS